MASIFGGGVQYHRCRKLAHTYMYQVHDLRRTPVDSERACLSRSLCFYLPPVRPFLSFTMQLFLQKNAASMMPAMYLLLLMLAVRRRRRRRSPLAAVPDASPGWGPRIPRETRPPVVSVAREREKGVWE